MVWKKKADLRGPRGASIKSVRIIDDRLVVTADDGRTLVAGTIVGKPGLPGPGAVSNDEANAALIGTDGTLTRAALQQPFARRESEALAWQIATRDQLPPPALAGVSATGLAYANLVGMLDDGRKIVTAASFSAGQIGTTTDGVSVAWGKNFEGGNGIVEGVAETVDGELLVAVMHRDNTAGVLYRSNGWDPTTANAVSWSVVLTASGPSVHFDGRWCLHQRSIAPRWSARPHSVFVAEYGNHFNEATSDDKAAIHVYLSEDDGATFRPIFDLRDHHVDANAHVHAVTYDPYDDRVIVSVGDNANAAIFYCNGEDLDDPYWTEIPGTSKSSSVQATTIIPMPNGLICLSDSPISEIRRIPRLSWRRYGTLETIFSISTGNPAVIGAHAYQRGWNGPLLMSFYSSSGTGAPAIYATRDGKTVVPIHTESAAASTGPGIIQVVGPDARGKIWATRNLSGSGALIAGTYSEPVPGATGGGGSSGPSVGSGAAKYGLVAQTYAAHLASSTSAALAGGTVYVMKVTAEEAAAAAARRVRLFQSTAASGLTLAKIAVFDSSGTRLGVSADIASMLMTAGPVTRTISVGSFSLVKGAEYYVALLVVGSTGPVLGRTSNSGVANAGLSGSALLWSTAATSAADMPATIDPTALSSQATAFWFGLL